MNGLVGKALKVLEDGWTMKDGTLRLGNNVPNNPGMIQIFLGQIEGRDIDGNPLCLVYVSREKRPSFNHHKELTMEKAIQNWIQFESDHFCFLGNESMFSQGAGTYIDDIAAPIPMSDGSFHTALDTRTRVASWGASSGKKHSSNVVYTKGSL
ncbi:hypothetical protein L7F22_029445 [Adiantum nelumboides]|nr:hypothetical protein [Adiantum nelumboides]